MKGKRRLLTGVLCLAMLFADVGPMSLQVMASEAGQEKSTVSAGSERQDADTVSLTEKEDETGDGAATTEDVDDSGDEKTSSEENSGVGSESGAAEGNGQTGTESGSPEAGEQAGDESGSVGDFGEKPEGDGTQGGESAPGENENAEGEDGEGTDVEEDEEETVDETVSENTVAISEELEAETDIAYAVTDGNIYFDESSGTITDCDVSVTKAEIPSQINGVEVVGIGAGAFQGCSNLLSIAMSNSIITIGDYAFSDCGSLKKIILPERVETLGCYIIKGTSIESIIIPATVISSGCESGKSYYRRLFAGAVAGCTTLQEVIFEEGIKKIPAYICASDMNKYKPIKKVIIPDSVEIIEDYAFASCDGLSSISIPNSVISIEMCAFANCDGLTSITVPGSVVSIGESAFGGCTSMEKIIISEGVEKLGAGFIEGTSVQSITIPSTVANSGYRDTADNNHSYNKRYNGALASCMTLQEVIFAEGTKKIPAYICANMLNSYYSSKKDHQLKRIIIPDSVSEIGNYAFSGCTALKELIIPEGVTSLGICFIKNTSIENIIIPSTVISSNYTKDNGRQPDGALAGCDKLHKVIFSEGIKKIPSYICASRISGFSCIDNIIIPDSVEAIGEEAFSGCVSLSSIIISDNVKSIESNAFCGCENLYNVVFKGERPDLSSDIFWGVTAEVYYPAWKSSWDSAINKNYGGTLTWIPYEEGTTPWEIENGSSVPRLRIFLETNPKKITYKDSYSCSQFDMNVTVMCMLPSMEAPTYDNVTAKIELSDGLSYTENAVNTSYTKNLGTMNFDAVKRHDISVPVYIDQDHITSEFQVTVSVTADGYESAQTRTFSIPVDLSVDRAVSIVDAVERYTALDEIREVNAIMASCESDEEVMEKLFEYYNYDNMMDVADRISTLSATHRESWDYNGLIQNEIFLSYGFYNYLNNTPEGVGARACLYGSGLVFNGEIMDWIDFSTYQDGDFPGVEKYKSMLEEFIDKESTQIEYYSTLKATQSFIDDSVGMCSKIEKGEALKELGKQTNVVGVRSAFNNFCTTKIEGLDGKDIVIDFEETTPFMEAMDMVGTAFKMTNLTLDGIKDFVDVSANLETYKLYHNFLREICEADDLPWEMRVAAYKLDKEMEDAYWTPVKKIMKTIRDECFDKTLNLGRFHAVVEANSYLAMVNYTAIVINQFVDIGKLVVNSCHTEGYAFLQMHYRDKLVQYKNEFVADKTPENAWKFYEAYMMLWKLRKAGEEKYLEMNRLEGGKVVDNLSQWITGGTLSGLISNMCGYKEKEEAVKQNLQLLDKLAFKFNGKDIPDELMYLRKTVLECPVNVELVSSDGTLIAALNDKEETSVSNDYGKFVSFFRATTGDYVKIAYFNHADSFTVNATGTGKGKVSYTYVETQDHETYDVTGFNKVLVSPGSSIQIETEQKTYTIDQDADGVIDIEGEQADKKRVFVQFDYQDGRIIKIVYTDQNGYVVLPDVSLSNKKDFVGWYAEPDGIGEKFTAETIVKESRTVYAKWGNSSGDNPNDPITPEDPEKPGQGDVLDEDMPQGGIENIPKGLWISEVKPQAYTGKAIKPEVRVYDYKTLLKLKKDYTISYRNNTKANDAQATKTAPTITVTGKGNYSGKETQTFQILPKDITDDDVIADDIVLKANKRMQKPVPVVSWSGKRLTNKRDFSISYTDATTGAYKDCGTYEITLAGTGNYTGNRRIILTITEGKPVSKLSISKIAGQSYTGSEIKPALTVKDGKTLLTENVHYMVEYRNNVDVGTATVLLNGIGNYIGTKRISFKIKAVASLKNAKVILTDKNGQKYVGGTYSGEEISPSSYTLTVAVKGADKKSTSLTLKEGVDYQVSYKNHIQAGTASIQFSGINGYTGSIKKVYKIQPYQFETDATQGGRIKVALDQSYCYVKGGCKPKPVITFNGRELQEKVDYTLSYKNNTKLNDGSNAAKLPALVIKGKGNFKGKIERTYSIAPADISTLSLNATDKVWKNKGNIYKTKVVIKDVDNRALSAGRDYDKNFIYTYYEDIRLADGTVKTAGTVISSKDIIPAGSAIGVTVNAKGSNYYGSIYGIYRIAKADIGKATVKIPAQIYTGKAIKPDDEIEIKLNRNLLSKENYEIVSYNNNINRGTATVSIRGKNDCGGTKTVKFSIRSKGFLWWWRN